MAEQRWSSLEDLRKPRGPYYVFIAADGVRGAYLVGATNDVVKFVCDRNDFLEPGQKDFIAVFAEEVSKHDFDVAESRRAAMSALSREDIYAIVEKGNPGWVDIFRNR
jgi:hypothetical protein